MAAQKIKTFGTEKKGKVSDLEPIVFEYYGENLTAKAFVPGLATLKYLEGISSDSSSDQLKAVRYYLEVSFDAENKDKFEKVADEEENGIELGDLIELMGWLVEERSNRPLTDSSAS